jgi:uncharacterized protein YbjT (DUF2867 family)
MYAVLGATGHTGSVVVRELAERGAKVRALVRDAAKAERARALGAEVVRLDMTDVASLTEGLRGARGAYLLVPPFVDAPDLLAHAEQVTERMAQAVEAARVPHVVLLSSIGAQHPAGTGLIRTNRHAERTLRAVAPALTALRAPYFMENWGESLEALPAGQLLTMIAPEQSIPMIATEDIGKAAAQLLLEGTRGHEVVELFGPREYSPRQVAASLTKLVGREVTPQHLPDQAIVPALTAAGMSEATAELFREMYEAITARRAVHEGGHRVIHGTHPLDAVLEGLLAPPRTA